MIDAVTNAALTNLLAPAILFFALGALAGWAKSDLSFPDQAAKALSLYLMLCIGFKGGVEARASGFTDDLVASGALGLAFSFLAPFAAFWVLHRLCNLERITAAATAAHYGSVSVVTFAAGTEYLRAMGVEFSGHMSAVLALMETPAILAALLIVGSRARDPGTSFRPDIWREVLLNGAAVLLIGSFVIGLLTGAAGKAQLAGFVSGAAFQGALCLFLLDMGLLAARRLQETRAIRFRLVAFACLWPLASGAVAVFAGRAFGLSPGDMTLLAILAASASYIAVPAAMRLALPKADAGIYIPMPLAMTFPFNLVIGIPLYHAAAQLLGG